MITDNCSYLFFFFIYIHDYLLIFLFSIRFLIVTRSQRTAAAVLTTYAPPIPMPLLTDPEHVLDIIITLFYIIIIIIKWVQYGAVRFFRLS